MRRIMIGMIIGWNDTHSICVYTCVYVCMSYIIYILIIERKLLVADMHHR